MAENNTVNPFEQAFEKEGRRSVIYDYCQNLQKEGHEQCIWICLRRGGKWIARDIPVKEQEKGIQICVGELRKLSRWWKRHSFYSAVGVQEAMIRFMGYNPEKNEIHVVVTDFDYKGKQRELDEAISLLLKNDYVPFECGVNITGENDCANEQYVLCPNTLFDDDDDTPYCAVQRIQQLSLRRDNYRFLASMLEYYWQNGIEDEGIRFLKKSEFITTYKHVATDKFSDAANPYGKTVYAFLVLEGWHIRYMLCLFMLSLLCSICIVAIVTAVSRRLEAGLTAGSYAIGVATAFLGLITILSAII
ncbi:hypothetical protein BDW67DRAFT_154087 [Aspergillus spinulosporus]